MIRKVSLLLLTPIILEVGVLYFIYSRYLDYIAMVLNAGAFLFFSLEFYRNGYAENSELMHAKALDAEEKKNHFLVMRNLFLKGLLYFVIIGITVAYFFKVSVSISMILGLLSSSGVYRTLNSTPEKESFSEKFSEMPKEVRDRLVLIILGIIGIAIVIIGMALKSVI